MTEQHTAQHEETTRTLEDAGPMNAQTLVAYWLGSRRAILQIAASPSAVWLGLLLVLTAGIAREYDGEDLLSEPWQLLIPLVASFATATLLFSGLWLISASTYRRLPPIVRPYLAFLSLYWLTAPMAWLYAIPVERFLDERSAAQANLVLLGVVSVWRVALITRVVVVLFGVRAYMAWLPVMLFADTVALGARYAMQVPLIQIMGGIHLSTTDAVLQEGTLLLVAVGTLTYPVWLIGSMLVAYSKSHPWSPGMCSRSWGMPLGLWSLPAVAVLGGAALLQWAQTEQRLRHRVESHIADGRMDEAIRLLSAHAREDLPPFWTIPDLNRSATGKVEILTLLERPDDGGMAPWVRAMLWEQLVDFLSREEYETRTFWQLSSHDFDRLMTILEHAPDRTTHAATLYGVLHEAQLDVRQRTAAEHRRYQALVDALKVELRATTNEAPNERVPDVH